MSAAVKRRLTPAEYLQIERAASFRSEYYDGEMFAMAGASLAHLRIIQNLNYELLHQLRGGPCEVTVIDLRVKVDATGLYTYPDIVIVCEKPQLEDDVLDTLLNPQVIVEVLSDSTEKYDRGKKFAHYRQIASLKEYILVAQDRMSVERFVRQPDESWLLTARTDPAQHFTFGTLPVTIPLEVVYTNVTFPEANGAS